jgi:DNA-binding phage protein
MLGLGSAAGAVGASASAVDLPGNWGPPKVQPGTALGALEWSRQDDEKYIEDIRKQLFDVEDTEKAIAEMMVDILKDNDREDFRYLDPDIEAMKSFSGIAKIRLQARRMAERSLRNRKQSLISQLNHWLEKIEEKAK